MRPRSAHRRAQGPVWSNFSLWIYFPLALALILGVLYAWKSGRWLVADDGAAGSGWAIVLAGESQDCERSDEAVKLYLEGRVDTLVLSGDRIFKHRYTSEFMKEHLAGEGVPPGKIFEFRHDASNTVEEARMLIRQMRLQNVDTVLIITSDFHSARARRVYRKLAQGFPVTLVHPADYRGYDPSAWWSSRMSRAIWAREWGGTIQAWFELLGSPPETGKAEYQNLLPDIWSGSASDSSAPSMPASPAAPGNADTIPASEAGAPAADSAAPSVPDTLRGASAAGANAGDAADSAAGREGVKGDQAGKTAEAAETAETKPKTKTVPADRIKDSKKAPKPPAEKVKKKKSGR